MNLSFSKEIKKELCNLDLGCFNCEKSLFYGMLIFNKSISKNLVFMKEKELHFLKIYFDFNDNNYILFNLADFAEFCSYSKIIYFLNHCDFNSVFDIISKNICCLSSFLRGAFLVCGSISDPNKEYHMEYTIISDDLASHFLNLTQKIEIHFKRSIRKNTYILYLKESELIEDMLTIIGASKFSLEIMNIKIFKNIRNKVNRIINCETANIDKIVASSSFQIKDIKYIKLKKGLDFLENDLKKVACIRLKNPDMSLQELSLKLPNNPSKSTVHRKLKKISKIANDLREQYG